MGRHIYTFENICKEDKGIFLNDGAVKLFLNAASDMDDTSKELRAFLDYVAGRETEDDYVEKLKEAVKQAKKNRKWRHEYMTLLMRDQENVERGKQQGIQQGIQKGIHGAVSMCRELKLSDEEIVKMLQKTYHLTDQEAEMYMKEMPLWES